MRFKIGDRVKATVRGSGVLIGVVKSIYRDNSFSFINGSLKLYWIVFDEGQTLLHTWVKEEKLERDVEQVVFT